MKKIKKIRITQITVALLLLIFCITACTKKSEEESTPVIKEETSKDEDAKEETTKEEVKEDIAPKEEVPSALPLDIMISYGNADATGFDTQKTSIKELSPEEVLQALSAHGAIPADVKVLSSNQTDQAGKKSLDLDMNAAFATFVQSMGTAGEYYAIGSICNTFLEAYGCEQIKLTVEGQVLSTGHADYPSYMTKHQ